MRDTLQLFGWRICTVAMVKKGKAAGDKNMKGYFVF